jgi:hypothetical protein
VDQHEDAGPAYRLFLPSFCGLWSCRGAHSVRRPGTPRWEPTFCVLPDRAATDVRTAAPVDGGLW